MMTLEEAVKKMRCRKGVADGITENGAYWYAYGTPLKIRDACVFFAYASSSYPAIDWYLELRHYRDGTVRAALHRKEFTQEYGNCHSYFNRDSILSSLTIEDVIADLCKGVVVDKDNETCLRNRGKLRDLLRALGMEEAAPPPDGDEDADED